eukprot:TRINITY_DN3737_c0_g2_i6.p1 TRINITY_DN3737_c0_g2~~TRINITY_DN3737_c0_g2_i6.p1  ORF type:complete len:574 (-),score=178.69 TRINITY_DN3737_c0_g2_i6:372-2093(-)
MKGNDPLAASMAPEEELTELKRRFNLLEGDRKAYYETSQWTIRQNRETVNTIRSENKQLRQAITNLQKGHSEAQLKGTLETEKVKLDQMVSDLRKKHGRLVAVSKAKESELLSLQDCLKDLEKESGAPTASDDSPLTRQIRALENRLDKAMIKYNEAISIKKTYQQIVRRLQEERLTFDNQLQAIERAIKAKERDYEELIVMCRDANHARDVALAELARFEQTIEEERKGREAELAERRQMVKAKMEMNERMEKRRLEQNEQRIREEEKERQMRKEQMNEESHREEEQAKKITSYEEAFRKIKEATGVSDVNEVIQKFLTQEETHNNLQALKQEAQARIDTLNEEKAQMKAKVEEIKYSASGSLGSRRIVDEFETHLSEANVKCERNRQKYERIAKVLVNVKAGIEHLADRLESIRIDQPPVAMSDETVVDVLTLCELKLAKVLETVVAEVDPQASIGDAPSPKHLTVDSDLPQFNIRVKLPNVAEDGEEVGPEDSGDEDDDDEVLDRSQIKRDASNVLDRMNKKPKGKKKGGKLRGSSSVSSLDKESTQKEAPARSGTRGAASTGKKATEME